MGTHARTHAQLSWADTRFAVLLIPPRALRTDFLDLSMEGAKETCMYVDEMEWKYMENEICTFRSFGGTVPIHILS